MDDFENFKNQEAQEPLKRSRTFKKKKNKMNDSQKQRIEEVKNYDYTTKYECITKSVASINKNGCVAVCINCDKYHTIDQITKQIEFKIYRDSTTEFVKIKNVDTESYTCSAISLNENDLVLLFQADEKINRYGYDKFLPQILHLYDLKKSETIKLQVQIGFLIKKTIRSFMNEENIYFITEEMPFIHIFNLKLEHLGSVGSLNYPNQYYIESNEIFIHNGYIFCQNGNIVGILNETTGVFLKKLELIEDEFEIVGINKNSEIFIFAPKKQLIQKYSIDCKLEKEYDLTEEFDSINESKSIQMNENGKILINDKKNLKLKIFDI
jgi:hypothetical protein